MICSPSNDINNEHLIKEKGFWKKIRLLIKFDFCEFSTKRNILMKYLCESFTLGSSTLQSRIIGT